MISIRRCGVALAAILALSGGALPASAQMTVFDPSNYSQNLLTAARTLQQVNNQILSLQNEAQMLINQARHLTSLPYSSLQQLQQSIGRTRQLLGQAQNIAYDVQQIDRAFSTTYAPASANQSAQSLIANAQTRWQNSVAGLQDALRIQATVVGNLDTNRSECPRSSMPARARQGHWRRRRPVTSSSPFRHSSSPISRRRSLRRGGPRASRRPRGWPPRTRRGNSFAASSRPTRAISRPPSACSMNKPAAAWARGTE
jgi:hypothetical protein